ncbi:hypothetical protein D3C85_1427880 [compost metagenome]
MVAGIVDVIDVAARATLHAVGAAAAIEAVVAALTIQAVVAAQALQGVIAGTATDDVGTLGGLLDLVMEVGENLARPPEGAVGEL